MSGNGAYGSEMNEIALFESALRAAVPSHPDPALGRDLVPRLAQTARLSTVEAENRSSRRAPRSRFALVARVGIAVAAIPLVLAGLAVAGVTVPSPARSAFDSVGIHLPNQSSHHHASGSAVSHSTTSTTSAPTTGNDVSAAAKSPAHRHHGGNSAAAHRHALRQHSKSHGKAVGHGHGRAVGLNGSTPPGHSGTTGSSSHSNGSSSSGTSSSHGSSGSHPTHPTHPSHPSSGPPSGHKPGGNANGHSK
jgi:hypothetical protein